MPNLILFYFFNRSGIVHESKGNLALSIGLNIRDSNI